MTAAPPPAVVLLSGGLDSATCLAIAQADGFAPRAISFRYGQRHTVELQAAAVIAANAEIEHVIVDIDLWAFGGSALTADIEVPKHADIAELDADNSEDIPITYVPARNTIFLSIALAFAEVRGAFDIFIGVNALDYSGYPDCRPEYIEAYERMANLATKSAVQPGPGEETCDEGTSVEGTSERREPEEPRIRIHTPLIAMTKAEIIRLGLKLGVDYGATTSCYDPIVSHRAADGWLACGRCDSCLLRRKGFNDAGLTDPIRYADASGSARP